MKRQQAKSNDLKVKSACVLDTILEQLTAWETAYFWTSKVGKRNLYLIKAYQFSFLVSEPENIPNTNSFS